MIQKWVPRPIRLWLRQRLRETVLVGMALPVSVLKYQPYVKDSDSYVLPKVVCPRLDVDSGLPVPPREMWLGYADTQEEYLASGKRHVSNMLDILSASRFSLDPGRRILDFGCGAGRMIRQLEPFSAVCEIWGADIDAGCIYWCKQHLEPPFHFLTTSTLPHLPFTDGYFDFIYAGSVFTHIDDLADSWLLELRRLLSPEGRLYITIHDEHTMDLLDTTYNHTWLSRVICSTDAYRAARKSGGKIVIGRDIYSQVFYDLGFFRQSLEPIYDIVSVTPEAYDYQTAILLRHKRAAIGRSIRQSFVDTGTGLL